MDQTGYTQNRDDVPLATEWVDMNRTRRGAQSKRLRAQCLSCVDKNAAAAALHGGARLVRSVRAGYPPLTARKFRCRGVRRLLLAGPQRPHRLALTSASSLSLCTFPSAARRGHRPYCSMRVPVQVRLSQAWTHQHSKATWPATPTYV